MTVDYHIMDHRIFLRLLGVFLVYVLLQLVVNVKQVDAGCAKDSKLIKGWLCPHSCQCTGDGIVRLVVDCSHKSIRQVPSELPSNVTDLYLGGNLLNVLGQQDFKGCSKLTLLDVSDNRVSMMEAGAFKDVRALKKLFLNHNQLSNTTDFKQCLSSLTSLEELRMHDNTVLSDEIFENLINLRTLTIDRQDVVTFGTTFLKLKSLKSLSVHGNFRVLSNESFLQLSASPLKELSMKSKNTLAFLEPLTFACLSQLETLDLGCNKGVGFVNVSRSWYGLNNTKIKTLNLTRIIADDDVSNVVTEEFFKYLDECSITKLLLNRNNIVEIGKGLSAGFPQLEYFDLSFNRLSNVATLVYEIAKMRHLKYGDFSYSNKRYLMRKRSTSDSNVAQVDYNNTESNRKLAGDKVLYDNNKCKTPSIQPCKFSSFPQLLALYNDMVGFKKDIPLPDFGPWCIMLSPGMEVVNLSSSLNVDLKFFPQVIILGRSNMSYMAYRSNDIDAFTGPLFFADSSKDVPLTVDLGDNGATCLAPDAMKLTIERGANLGRLLLDKNSLGDQLNRDREGETFKHYQNLTELNLARNDLKSLPIDVFQHLQVLEILNLSANSLRNISFNTAHFKALKILDLSNNLLTDVSDGITKELQELIERFNTSINLNGNPIQCSCATMSFLQWLSDNEPNILELSTMSCIYNGTFVTFDKLQTYLLKQLQFDCATNLLLITAGALLGLACFTVLVYIFLYRHRWDIRYYLLNIRNSRKQYQKIQDGSINYKYDAFISYDTRDRRWVIKELVYRLEKVKHHQMNITGADGTTEFRSYRFCVHDRDFPAGGDIQENIITAMKSSRKVILVLSQNFQTSKWCRFELEMCQRLGFNRGLNLAVPIIISDLSLEENLMPSSLRWLIRRKTYIQWNQSEYAMVDFWRRLHNVLLSPGTENWICECGKTIFDQLHENEEHECCSSATENI